MASALSFYGIQLKSFDLACEDSYLEYRRMIKRYLKWKYLTADLSLHTLLKIKGGEGRCILRSPMPAWNRKLHLLN